VTLWPLELEDRRLAVRGLALSMCGSSWLSLSACSLSDWTGHKLIIIKSRHHGHSPGHGLVVDGGLWSSLLPSLGLSPSD
jgi:hypothetical protein